jgi:hypothetical protein
MIKNKRKWEGKQEKAVLLKEHLYLKLLASTLLQFTMFVIDLMVNCPQVHVVGGR